MDVILYSKEQIKHEDDSRKKVGEIDKNDSEGNKTRLFLKFKQK